MRLLCVTFGVQKDTFMKKLLFNFLMCPYFYTFLLMTSLNKQMFKYGVANPQHRILIVYVYKTNVTASMESYMLQCVT